MPSTPLELLSAYFGYTSFRPGQQEAIDAVLNAQDTVAIMPTGSGKSLCYQIPSMLLPGLTLVISPLIALMKDQVDSLTRLGIPATFLNSTLSAAQAEERLAELRSGGYKLLYVAPERFRVASFHRLISQMEISLLAIDEAHCISQWGHDFRPSYLKIKEIREQAGNPTLIALTATATPRVREDIIEQLGLKNPLLLVKGFDRPNLKFFAVEFDKEKQKKNELVRMIRAIKGSGIVYVATQKAVAEIQSLLKEEGIFTAGYHGGMDKHQRESTQNRWLSGQAEVIVATNAFGMGIDKADVRFVIHYNIPGSVEAYYQEAGRAGRDGKTAYCILFFTYRDHMIQEYLIENSFPPESVLNDIYVYLFSLQKRQILLTYREIAQAVGCNDMQVGSAIKLFERYHILKRMQKNELSFSFELLKEIKEGLKEVHRAPIQSQVLTWISKQTTGHQTLKRALMELQISLDQFNHAMRQLVRRGLIHYEPPFRGRGVEVTSKYVPWSKVPIDFELYEKQKQQQFDRLDEIEAYVEKRICRRKYLLNYFGEPFKKENCGACDVCLNWKSPELEKKSKTKSSKRKEPAGRMKNLIDALVEFDGVFGVTTLAKILKGVHEPRFDSWGIPDNPVFGSFMEMSEKAIIRLIYAAVKEGYLERGNDKYPKIRLTEKGLKFFATATEPALPRKKRNKRQ